MKRYIPNLIAAMAVAGLILITRNTATAQTVDILDQSGFPVITAQPTDQAVIAGSNVVLSVQAVYADNYQWQSNGVDIAGQTNTTLVLPNVGVNGAGAYSCNVSQSGGDPVPTRAASVLVETAANKSGGGIQADGILGGGPITVSGAPKASNGTINPCPGSFDGYVNYSKTISQGWGWTPITGTTVLTASDGSGRTDTTISYFGKYGDTGCGQTSVTVPYPPPSPAYRFTINFPNNVPTTNYPITLTGFNP
jgi:hypothetical protein